MEITIGIKLPVAAIPAKACMAAKKATGLSLGEVKARALNDEYIFECPVADDDGLELIINLRKELAHFGVKARLFEDGREDDPELFDNLKHLHDEINRNHC